MKVREVIVVGLGPRVIVVVFVRAGKGVGVIGGWVGIVGCVLCRVGVRLRRGRKEES